MKILHLDGFSTEEKLKYKTIIYTNIIASMKTLIQACKDLNIPIDDEVKKNRKWENFKNFLLEERWGGRWVRFWQSFNSWIGNQN